MSEKGPVGSQSGDTGQSPPKTENLFQLMVELMAIIGLYLLAALLTEAWNTYLVPLDSTAYLLFVLFLFILLLGLTGLFCWALKDPKKAQADGGSIINAPGVLQKGLDRIRRWQSRASRQYVLYMAIVIMILISTAARISKGLVDSIYAGPRQSFYEILAMAAGGFGSVIICLLASCLIVGLLPEKPRND